MQTAIFENAQSCNAHRKSKDNLLRISAGGAARHGCGGESLIPFVCKVMPLCTRASPNPGTPHRRDDSSSPPEVQPTFAMYSCVDLLLRVHLNIHVSLELFAWEKRIHVLQRLRHQRAVFPYI